MGEEEERVTPIEACRPGGVDASGLCVRSATFAGEMVHPHSLV